MNIKSAKKLTNFLKITPFHPQWPVYKLEKLAYKYISTSLIYQGTSVLDVGCGHRGIEKLLSSNINYVGLDLYQTATEWYKSLPDIFADAHNLPISSNEFDYVLLLEVLEHLKDPIKAIDEISRVLKMDGLAIITVPALYPLHDEPYDFHRWTRHGLNQLIERQGNMQVVKIQELGGSLSSSSVLFNLAISERVLLFLKKSPLFWFMVPFAAVAIFCSNIFSMLDRLNKSEFTIAPLGYLIVARKV